MILQSLIMNRGFIERFAEAFNLKIYDDPVKNCDVHKEIGCSHVDGMLCHFPKCDTYQEYVSNKESLLADLEKSLLSSSSGFDSLQGHHNNEGDDMSKTSGEIISQLKAEILTMARDQVMQKYYEAKEHAEKSFNVTASREEKPQAQFPDLPVFPTEEDIITSASKLYKFILC